MHKKIVQTPLVSVIVLANDDEEDLRRTLHSLFIQRMHNFEVLVVFDGNAKKENTLPKEWNERDIHFLYHDIARGTPASCNSGIRASRGSYIAFVEAGDCFHPDKLKTQFDLLSQSAHDIAFSSTNTNTNSTKKNLKSKHVQSSFAIPTQSEGFQCALFDFRFFTLSTLMIKKSAFEAVGYFDESLPTHHDVDIAIRLSKLFRYIHIALPLTVMKSKKIFVANTFEWEKRIRGREIVLIKHEEYYQPYPSSLAGHYFVLGTWCRNARQNKKSSKYFMRAWNEKKHVRYFVHSLLSRYRT